MVLGKNRHIRPPPASRIATMKVGAGQYRSRSVAITTFPMIPPRRAATIEMATPVALRFVGKTSVMRQSREAFPIEITPLKIAETARFWCLFVTRYIEAEQRPADIVLNTRKNFLPSLSMNRTAITFAGKAAATVISDSRKTVLGMVAEQTPVSEWEPILTT